MGRPNAGIARDLTETIGLPGRPRKAVEPAPLIPDYRFVKIIGRGAFGTVWLAEETMAGMFRAIKVLRPRRSAAPVEPVMPSDRRASLVDRELDGIHAFQVLAKDHPHLIHILKTGLCKIEEPGESIRAATVRERTAIDPATATGEPLADARGSVRTAVYYVMEIADHAGGAQPHHPMDYQPLTLAALLRRRGRLPCSEVIEYAGELLDAIDHLHKAGLHHRDIKPANVLFVGGVLKLGDMGLTASDNDESVGTPGYLTPEGRPDDLYALGKIIYEVLTGLPARSFPEWPGDLEPGADGLLAPLRSLVNEICQPDGGKRSRHEREIAGRLAALVAPSQKATISRRAVLRWVCLVSLLGLGLGWLGRELLYQAYRPMGVARRVGAYPFTDSKSGPFARNDGKTEFTLTRQHSAGVTYTIGEPNTTLARFTDVQTTLMDGRLVAAGAYQIHNIGNPCGGDVSISNGEIDAIWLIVGEGEKSVMKMLYFGEPGAKPGVEARFRTWIDFAEIAASFEAGTEVPVYLAFSPSQSEQHGRVNWCQEGRTNTRSLLIATLNHRPFP